MLLYFAESMVTYRFHHTVYDEKLISEINLIMMNYDIIYCRPK